ncbi:hypothetical protein [Lichenifustis flavocetrariae]|uniref:Uncharacterized protein n=1 Tax=Lichenifustis flavocetrariae TaxID=2949735 RepID=A0AA42CID3_9HYPH|nr:hypothetical protein [Lichenifustis flavocetrariae]MCW6506736.1 hypothetical protein [Lichenifustis flavocetrariae]
MPHEAVTASLAQPAPAQAIDLGTTDIPAGPTAAERAQQIRAFVDRYDGGPCFFAAVRQVSATNAEIESFATMPGTFQQFDRALKTSTGIEATVSGQRIWSAQCSAVEYLRRLPHDTDSGPSLVLERRALDRGDTLSGTIGGAAGRPLRLFVIAESGAVTDISDAVSEHDGNPSFSFRPQLSTPGGPFPQILVLVAGAVTLPLHPVTADDIFKPLFAGKGAAYTVAAKMFLAVR